MKKNILQEENFPKLFHLVFPTQIYSPAARTKKNKITCLGTGGHISYTIGIKITINIFIFVPNLVLFTPSNFRYG